MTAQDEVKPFGINVTYHYGAIIPHKEVVNEIIEGNTQVVELSFFKQTIGETPWSQLYNYPKVGFSLLYFNLANPKQLGKSFGVYPYLLLTYGKGSVRWSNKFGAGVGYIEKPYNRKTNYQNLVIGSTFNALIYTNTQLDIEWSNKINTSLGLSFVHFSNGAFTMPNLGINILSLNMGMTYQFGDETVFIKKELKERARVWTKNVTIGVGIKEIPPVEGPKYGIVTTSFNVMKVRSNKSSFGAGIDFFYNSSLTKLLAEETAYVKSNTDNVRAGVTLIYALDFGKFSTLIQLGSYLYNKEKEKGMVYNRVQLRYHTNKKIFINLGLKTHVAVADFVELGVGYQFK